jgi:5-methyltetrahydrofolate--homocysteine methyltransferase
VAGDIHDIGKDVVTFMLDVNNSRCMTWALTCRLRSSWTQSASTSLSRVERFLTLAFEQMKRTVDAIAEAGLRDDVKIMIGGAIMDASAAQYVGQTPRSDAASAVRLAKSWTGGA